MTDPYNAQDRPHNAQSAPAPNGAYTGGTVSADVEAIKKNALIAMIVGFVCGGVLPGVLGLLGYLKADTEPRPRASSPSGPGSRSRSAGPLPSSS